MDKNRFNKSVAKSVTNMKLVTILVTDLIHKVKVVDLINRSLNYSLILKLVTDLATDYINKMKVEN